MALLCILRHYADLLQNGDRAVYDEYVTGEDHADTLVLLYATKDNYEEDMKECHSMMNV